MTHVADPLELLGALTADCSRQRTRARRIAALGDFERMFAMFGVSLMLGASCISLAPQIGAAWERAQLHLFAAMPEARVAVVTPADAAPARPRPMLASAEPVFDLAAAQEQVAARASVLALAGERLPADVAALRETRVAEAPTPALAPADLVPEAAAEVALVTPHKTVMLSQLPPQSSVSRGIEVTPGVWALALEDLAGLDVKLPPGGRRQVTARVEIDGTAGGDVKSYGLVVPSAGAAHKASGGVAARAPAKATKVQRPVRRVVAAPQQRPRPEPWGGADAKRATETNAGVAEPIVPAADAVPTEANPPFGIGKAWGYVAGH